MRNKMTKSQSALEYMMTYGWAILIIVIVAAVLYSMGIFSPSSSASATVTGFSGLGSVTAQCYANGVLRIQLGNNVGKTINITKITAIGNGNTVSFSGNATVDPNPEIAPDGTYTFSFSNVCPVAGSSFSVSLSVNYTEPGQAFSGPYSSGGTVSGKVSQTVLPVAVSSFKNSFLNQQGGYTQFNIGATSSDLTFTAWVYQTSFGQGGTVVEIRGNGTSHPGIGAGSQANPYLHAVGCGSRVASKAISSGKWYFMAVTFSPNLENLYVNSVLNNTISASLGGLNNVAGPASTGNQMGEGIGCGDGYYGGYISDLQIYNTTLSQSQITSLYSEGVGGLPVGGQQLLIWFQLNNTFKDFSTNGNNAALVAGKITFTTDYPAP